MAKAKLNEGSAELKEDDEPQQTGDGPSIVKVIAWAVGLVTAVIIATVLVLVKTGRMQNPIGGYATTQTTAADDNQKKAHPQPELTPLPGPAFGLLPADTTDITEVEVPAGAKIRFSPVSPTGKVYAYRYYVDGVEVHHYTVEGAKQTGYSVTTVNKKYRAGFKLDPGQGLDELDFAVAVFFGPEGDWFVRCLNAGRIDRPPGT